LKKILGVVGSPRKNGNTHLLTAKILEGAQEEGAQTSLLFLNDLSIKECDGCHACWIKGKCSKKDDMSEIYLRISESDAIVFGTPVYWYGPTALMKGFIDRFVYFNCPENRSGIRGKLAALAIPFEEEKMETVVPVVSFFELSLKYLEMNLIGKIIVPGVTKKGEVIQKQDRMQEAYLLGRKLAGPIVNT
jgi:multimeric flavodoxin WrbA